MPESISWSYAVRALGGPSVALSGDQAADAYEKLSIKVVPAATQSVTIAPGKWTNVLSLVVSAAPLDGTVTMAPDGGTAKALNGPLLLVGTGAVALLGAGDATLVFKNTGLADAVIDIFVARDATA